MTERHGWLMIANWYLAPRPEEGRPSGICFAVDDLLEYRKISYQTHDVMINRLELFRPTRKNGKGVSCGYFWNRDDHEGRINAVLLLAEMTDEQLWEVDDPYGFR